MDKNMTSKTQNRVKLDPFWGALRPPLKDADLKGFLTLISKAGPKLTQKWSKRGQKWPKLGQIWVSGSRLGIFGTKRTVGTPKMSQRPFSGFENWFWQGFLARGQADCRKSRFPGLVWKGWRGKFGRMIFCYKNEKSVWKFLMNEIGKNENNVIFFVTNEKYGNYFDSSLRWPILTDLSLVSLKSLMNEF